MKAKIVAATAAVFCLALSAHAQSLIEYSHAAAHSASSVSGVAGALNSASKRTSAKLPGSSNSPKVWEAKPAPADHKAAKPTPP